MFRSICSISRRKIRCSFGRQYEFANEIVEVKIINYVMNTIHPPGHNYEICIAADAYVARVRGARSIAEFFPRCRGVAFDNERG